MRFCRVRTILATATVLVLASLPDAAGAQSEGLGIVTFPNSGAPEAQPAFLRGVLLLHNFEYDRAEVAFREARATDPDFALAYWGEALTHQRLLWGQDFLEEARAALARLGSDPAARAPKAPSARERGYLAALEALLGEGDVTARTDAFEAAMSDLHAAHPKDDEAAAFHALSILMAGDYGTARTAARAAGILEDVARRNPYHPGAVHYLIHAYDSPEMAPLGLHWARVYSQLAARAQHALHMPSHVFVHLGLWEEVAASNVASTRAAYAEAPSEGPDALHHPYHSFQWLSYAYLQLGRQAEAKAIVDSVTALLEGVDVRGEHWNTAHGVDVMNVLWGFETGDWSHFEGRQLPEPDPSSDFLGYALVLYGPGRAAAAAGDRERAARAAERLRAEGPPGPESRALLALQIEALAALETGEAEAAVALSREAIGKLDAFRHASPALFQPPLELHGEILLRAGRAGEAAEAFEGALERNPARARSLLGRARAAAAVGDAETARRFYAELREQWGRADPGLAGVAEARETVGAESTRGEGAGRAAPLASAPRELVIEPQHRERAVLEFDDLEHLGVLADGPPEEADHVR